MQLVPASLSGPLSMKEGEGKGGGAETSPSCMLASFTGKRLDKAYTNAQYQSAPASGRGPNMGRTNTQLQLHSSLTLTL